VELDENTRREMAEKQAGAKIGFKLHLASYLVGNGMLKRKMEKLNSRYEEGGG
jgi:hypothetical protein